jgi:uncharacterized protein (TIGR02118 family)
MIKISILYPNHKGRRFDVNYYLETHMPMAAKLIGARPGFRGVTVERGIGGATPESDAPFVVMTHLLFDSVEDFLAAFTPHAEALYNDLPNYSDTAPEIQVSEVVLSQ